MEIKAIATLLDISENTVLAKLGKLTYVLENLKTPAEAEELYNSCPRSMDEAVCKKWEGLVKKAIPALKTPAEAEELYNSCPRSMDEAVCKEVGGAS